MRGHCHQQWTREHRKMEGDGAGESARERSSGGQHLQPTTHTTHHTSHTHAHHTHTRTRTHYLKSLSPYPLTNTCPSVSSCCPESSTPQLIRTTMARQSSPYPFTSLVEPASFNTVRQAWRESRERERQRNQETNKERGREME